MIQPDVEGAAHAMREALEDAGVSPDQVGYINAHGTGTILNDANEAAALRAVFGEGLDRLPVSSSKPILGHALGAAGALELVVAVQALRYGMIPPQANYSKPDPKCPLLIPTGAAQPADLDTVLSNSFAFGGINATLVVRRGQ
jgi:nodulation protein E